MEMKSNLKEAKNSLHSSRVNNKNQVKEELTEGKLLFDACYEAELNEKTVSEV